MGNFYFPYNFYPAKKTSDDTKKTFDYQNNTNANGKATTKTTARHDLYQKGTYNGYFNISITNNTPLLIGNEHTGADPTEVKQYEYNNQVAIPGNSLRGVIASTAEILSNSTLRVLSDVYHPAFAAIDKDLVPWSSPRENLTPAELLFGVVAVDSDKSTNTAPAKNLASRVIFSDAICKQQNETNVFSDETTLEELSSPKPDPKSLANNVSAVACNHYFLNNSNQSVNHGYVKKILNGNNANGIKKLKPRGRKFYLQREKFKFEHCKNTGKDEKRKIKGKFIKENQTFTTRVKFTNLTAAELTLLKTSLSPSNNYQHYLGVGNSLGLGAVTIGIQSCIGSNRLERYAKTVLDGNDKRSLKLDSLTFDTLIDPAALKTLCAMNTPLPTKNVRWREGRNDKTRPVPQVQPDMNEPPISNDPGKQENTQPSNNIPHTPENIAIPDSPHDKALAQLDSPAANWLIQSIEKSNNGHSINTLSTDKIQTTLIGKPLSAEWDLRCKSDLKPAVLALIKTQITDRGIDPNDINAKARKRYGL